MGRSKPQDAVVRFGPFEMDRDACELRRDGQRVPLQIQPFKVLEALIDAAGRVVSRPELRQAVWPDTVYVDFDHGLNNAVNRLRQALQDDPETPIYIETLPRVGYRFIHEVAAPLGNAVSQSPIGAFTLPRPAWIIATGAVAALAVFLAVRTAPVPQPESGTLDQKSGVPNSAAYDAYLRGRDLFEQRSKESLALSIDYLKESVRLDPEYAPAFALLASVYMTAGGNSLVSFLDAEAVRDPALSAAQRAIQLDPQSASGYLAMAGVLDRLSPWSPDREIVVEDHYRRALELDSDAADAHLFYGNFLSSRGRSEEAVVHFRQAQAIDPLSPSVNSRLGAELVTLGDTELGLKYLLRTVELDPWQFNARVRLGWTYAAISRLVDAENAFNAAESISPQSIQSLAGLAYVAALEHDEVHARDLLETIIPKATDIGSPWSVAVVYVGLRDTDNALQWLRRVAEEDRILDRNGPYGIGSPIYDWLRNDDRFVQIERLIMAKADRTAL